MTTALQINNLRVTEAHRTVLSVDEASISESEIVAIMGPNGAGKSTFLRTCLGMQQHVSGEVFVFDQRLDLLSYSELTRIRRWMGYIPQNLPARIELPLTVREVVAIGRTGLAGLFRRLEEKDWKIVDEWLTRLGIFALAQRGFGEISGGEQRKVMIARAMVQQPRLLLLDEPTANLDLGWRERIVETIQSVYEETKLAVVLVCHELEVLPVCCKRVILLDQGRVIAVGSPEDVFTHRQVAALYGPGLSILHQNGRHAVIPQGGR
jgi:ABC-type cobalamin/Fe3+-siderophores transport system ATPase subunit